MTDHPSQADADRAGDPVPSGSLDWRGLVDGLNRLLRLRTTPIGMKLYETIEEMERIPRIRRPEQIHTADQIVSQAARLGWTVGVTADDLIGTQCAGVLGLCPQDDAWLAGKHLTGVWFATDADSAQHQQAMDVVPGGRYRAMAVSPLVSGRLDPPDICLLYATPGQMIIFINGLQWAGYRKFDWGVVGESACADSWGRALRTRQPSLALPCYAERRYGAVPDDELLMALPPSYIPKAIAGMEQLSKNGLRYPIALYGIQSDARAGLGYSYDR